MHWTQCRAGTSGSHSGSLLNAIPCLRCPVGPLLCKILFLCCLVCRPALQSIPPQFQSAFLRLSNNSDIRLLKQTYHSMHGQAFFMQFAYIDPCNTAQSSLQSKRFLPHTGRIPYLPHTRLLRIYLVLISIYPCKQVSVQLMRLDIPCNWWGWQRSPRFEIPQYLRTHFAGALTVLSQLMVRCSPGGRVEDELAARFFASSASSIPT